MNLSQSELTGLARVFGEKLRAALTDWQMGEVISRNYTEGPDSPVCHSHDFCDANVYMGEAWQEFFGQEPDVASDDDAAIWNAAWSLAKAANFYVGEFLPLANMEAWDSFWAANREALESEVGDESMCLALAMNCNLIIGGGAAPAFRVGFVD